jgi:hypothetical protein
LSLVDFVPRRSRSSKQSTDTQTPVQTALAEPPPTALAAMMARVENALADFNDASSARTDDDSDQSVAEARTKLEKLTANLHGATVKFELEQMRRRTVNPKLLDDVDGDIPTAETIAELQKALDAERDRLSNRAARKSAFDAEVERRRRTASERALELRDLLAPWRKEVIEAAEHQLALAARMAGDAYAVVAALEPWRTPHRVSLRKIVDEGMHDAEPSVVVPADVSLAVGLIVRGQ